MLQNIIVIDSNFILLPYQFKIDYLNEIRNLLEGTLKFIIFDQSIRELNSKVKRYSLATKFHTQFQSGLGYLEKNKEIFNIEYIDDLKDELETTDDFLLRKLITLKEESMIIYLATNDSGLRKKAKEKGFNTIFMRQKKFLTIERV
ncbi:MAG: PIN domain-containing protein [Candidatus Thorarchaeota archaeon]